jgi:hypothetical protein
MSRDVPLRQMVDGDLQLYTSSNPLPIAPFGNQTFVDEGNSYNDQSLSANQEIIGVWTDLLDYASVSMVVKATQLSQTNGAVIEFSNDTNEVTRTLSATIVGTILGGKPIYVSLPNQARYFRLRYTNSSTPGLLDVQTLLKRVPDAVAQAPLGAELDGFSTSQVVRAVQAGALDNGKFKNISVDNDAYLRVSISAQEVPIDIAGLSSENFDQVNVRTAADGGPDKLLSVNLAGRKSIAIKNSTVGRIVHVGTNPALTATSNSFPIDAGETLTLDFDSTVEIWAMADSGTAGDVRVAVIEVGSV